VFLGGVQLATNGGLSQHLLSFSVAGVHGGTSLLRGPNQILFNLLGHAWGTVVLFPLAVLGALLPNRLRQLSIFHVALVYAVLLLMIIYVDVGTGFNQLLDIVVLTSLAVGDLAGRALVSFERGEGAVIALAAVIATGWAAGIDLVRTVGLDVRGAMAASKVRPTTRGAVAAASLVKPDDTVLAEDPSIEVALRRQPAVMDPFMIMRLDRVRPEIVDPLIGWIDERRFDVVFLVVPLEDRDLDYWWSDFHYGSRVAAALRHSYRPDGTIGRYFVYRPR
jgi:hypothetical protein